MKRFQWLAVTAGIAALAACSSDETNTTNVEINAADDNMMLPPPDLNADVNLDVNADVNADTNAVDNMANNTTENTTNSY